MADISNGCAQVTLTAEITGPESEQWYCPSISWEKPDGTISFEESDCPPYEARHQCLESQEGCGLRGFKLDRETGKYIDDYKECPCTIIGYPRVWRHYLCAPPHPNGDTWTIVVYAKKGKQTLARNEVRFLVK